MKRWCPTKFCHGNEDPDIHDDAPDHEAIIHDDHEHECAPTPYLHTRNARAKRHGIP